MCWLYSVPNFLVIQHVEILYLGGNNVRIVCEIVWRNLSCVHSRGVSWLNLATNSWQAIHQSATHVKHARSWKVTTTEALQDKKYSLAWQLTYNSFQSRGPVARVPCVVQNLLFTFHFIPYYKYLYIHEMYGTEKGAYWEKNPKKGFYNTPTFLERRLLILREKSL